MLKIREVIHLINDYFARTLWEKDGSQEEGNLARCWFFFMQFVTIVFRNSLQNKCFLRASSLAFTSLLSLVPFLAIIFSLLKGLGVQNQVGPVLLEQLSAGSQDVAARIIKYIDNTQVTSLGSFGFAGLFVTVIMLLDSIEDSFNQIWIVSETRPLGRRIWGYLVLLVSMPALIFTALSLTTFLEGQEIFNWVLTSAQMGKILPYFLHLLPYLMVCLALTSLYKIVPNAMVSFRSALIGAFFAGTFWQIAQKCYVHFQFGVAKNNAIYGTMAALPTFMIWIYVSWVIVLLGVEIVHAHQNIRTLKREIRVGPVSQRIRQLVSLAILQDIAGTCGSSRSGWTGEHLGDALELPEKVLKDLLADLIDNGFIVRREDVPPLYVLARDPGQIMVGDVLAALNNSPAGWTPDILTKEETCLAELIARVEKCSADSLEGITLNDIAGCEGFSE